jgi:hypothetical protein
MAQLLISMKKSFSMPGRFLLSVYCSVLNQPTSSGENGYKFTDNHIRPIEKHRLPKRQHVADPGSSDQCATVHSATSGRIKLLKGMLKSTNKLITGLDDRYRQFWDNTQYKVHISNGNAGDWCEATQESTQENLKGLLHHINAARVLLMAMDSEHDQFHNSHKHLYERDYEYEDE